MVCYEFWVNKCIGNILGFDEVFMDIIRKGFVVYLDDILVYVRIKEEYLEKLWSILLWLW